MYIAWTLPEDDAAMHNATVSSALQLTNAAVAAGQEVGDAPLYPNYAVASTPLERIYGDQLDKLQAIKQQYDPGNVMGLAGGWKL